MALALTFNFVIHVKLIFVNDTRKGSNFILLHVVYNDHHFLKRLFVSH